LIESSWAAIDALFPDSGRKASAVTKIVSVTRDGPLAARAALEQCVADGEIAVFPADTLYGLACDPARPDAIARINELKRREADKPSAVMFFSPLAMRELVAALGPRTCDAMAALLPGPVTLVVDNPERRYSHAGGATPERLGVRLIDGPLAGAECAIFQTSANRSGEPAPSRFDDIDSEIADAVDLAIDGGELGGEPSTVIDLSAIESGGEWSVLREGALPISELERRLAAAGLPSR
jgi:L-threonylcarbamoyladenylate synthase